MFQGHASVLGLGHMECRYCLLSDFLLSCDLPTPTVQESHVSWNAGLISTEAGTIGRLCGNFLLSVVAKLTGDTSLTQLNHFGQTLFGLLAVISAASLGYMIAIWKRMAC